MKIHVAILLLMTSFSSTAFADKNPLVMISAGYYQRGLDLSLKANYPTIYLKSYYIEQDEVTNSLYEICVQEHGCKKIDYYGDGDYPLRDITWNDANNYCKHIGRRLPTEAEWEKAAFPSAETEISRGRGPLISPKFAPCYVLVIGGYQGKRCDVPHQGPVIVSIKNPFIDENNYFDRVEHDTQLVYDLFGNVAEWVADFKADMSHIENYSYFRPTELHNPNGPKEGSERVIRGSSYIAMQGVFMSERRAAPPTAHFPDVGFRCVADVQPAPPIQSAPEISVSKNDDDRKHDMHTEEYYRYLKICVGGMGLLLLFFMLRKRTKF